MTQFKGWNFNKGVLFLTAMAVLSACVKAERHDPYADQAGKSPTTFRMSRSGGVVDVSGYAENLITSNDIELVRKADTSTISREASYSNRREYSLKMCNLEDIRANNTVLGTKMTVYSELQIHEPNLMIQNDSCVYWQVSLPYNYFGDAVNLEINFIFKTLNGQKAYIHKRVLINPWDSKRGDNPEFFDFTRFGITKDLNRLRWARGLEEVDLAMQGKLVESTKRLEIATVNIVPVNKNRENFVETNLIGASLNDTLEKRQNENVRLSLNGGRALPTLDLHVNMRLDNLKVRLRDSAGNVHDEPLTTGRYRIYAQLVATDVEDRGHFILTDKLIVSNEREWKTNTMGVNAVLPVSLVIRPQWGNLNLVLKVVPVDIPGIEPFEGVYHLGRFNEIAGGKSPLFDLSEYSLDKGNNNLNFSYDEYLKRARNFKDWEKGLAEQAANEISTFEKGFRRFQFTALTVLFSRIMPGDTATDRTIQYTVETCLVDNFTGARPGGGLVFDIETEDRGQKFKIRRETNDLGCLTWVGMISHKFYQRENLVLKESILTYLGNDSNRPTYTISYYINPWDEKFTFGRDARVLPKEYIQQIADQQKIAPPTQVLITEFAYDATGFRYVVDRYMNLTVKKTVLMQIHPKILKYNSIVWGRSGLNEMRDGIYLLKIAMQKDYLDPASPGRKVHHSVVKGYSVARDETSLEKRQYLTVKELLVRVLGGKIVTPIEFDVTDLKTLRIRAQMLLQIETIDEMLLRAVALGDEKLNSLLGPSGSKKTLEIIDLQLSRDEINAKLDAANKEADTAEVKRKISELESDRSNVAQRLRKLLASLDEESFKSIIEQIDEMRKYGETGISVDRNMKARALDQMLRSIRNKVVKRVKVETETMEARRSQEERAQCRKIMNRLINEGRTSEAQAYEPRGEGKQGGTRCEIIPNDQMFFHLTTSPDVGTDDWLQTLFTEEEFKLYKSNILRDDFTKPYQPSYDFSLLSNEGDELAPGAADWVSGLPRRTFIGPITFVLNGNASAVRPTDVLDEASCNGTCEKLGEIENSIIENSEVNKKVIQKFGLPVNVAYENSPYFGSVRHFYKKQVNDLIQVQRGLSYQYHQEMLAFSQVGNLLDLGRLKYVSFAAKASPVYRIDYDCYQRWKDENEKVYEKWREGEDLTFRVHPIPSQGPESCFVKSDRTVDKATYVSALNKNLPPASGGWNPLMFAGRVQQLEPPQMATVTAAELKEFAKNGLVSRKLPLESKFNILHRMCSTLRQGLHYQDPAFYKRVAQRAVLDQSRFFRFSQGETGSQAAGLDAFHRVFDNFQKACHDHVATYEDDIRKLVSKKKMNADQINDLLLLKSRQLPLIVERKVRILQTSNRYLYKDGKTLNYSVGTAFSLSNSFGVNRGYKIDPMESIEKGVGEASGGLLKGGKAKAGKLFSSLLGAVNGVLNFAWGQNESMGDTNGTSVSDGTTLAAQISTLDIELSKWEKCVVVRFDDQYIIDQLASVPREIVDPVDDLDNLGQMLCSGDLDTEDDLNPGKPLRVRERYYYLTQIFNEGDMQDSGFLANHPWMMHLRGVRDFARFQRALKIQEKQFDWTTAWKVALNDIESLAVGMTDQRLNDKSSFVVVKPEDVGKALDMMSEAYQKALPTFPGLYTFPENRDDEVTNWPVE